MIIVSIGGGLGNQMFQYAFYTNLKTRYPDEEVKLDMYNTFHKAHNGYEIDKIFHLKADECTIDEANMLSDYYSLKGKHNMFNRYVYSIKRKLGKHKESFHEQRDYTEYYDEFVNLDKGKDYFFVGAFANVRYFSGIEDKVKKMYRFPEFQDENNKMINNRIENSKSVSIHIRRGDYAQLGITMPGVDYYRKAVDYIIHRIGDDAEFYVFSDDVEYSQNILGFIERKIVVSNNKDDKSYLDMSLMSKCKHNIIANSTFSFWGAYLNMNKDKIVIVPNLPFTGCKNIFTDDGWIVI